MKNVRIGSQILDLDAVVYAELLLPDADADRDQDVELVLYLPGGEICMRGGEKVLPWWELLCNRAVEHSVDSAFSAV